MTETSVYLIQPGDNLSAIAAKYNISLAQLLTINQHINNPDIVYPGQKINVPGPPPLANKGDLDQSIPPWLAIARLEMGVTEIPGAQDNPRIIEYHASTTLHATDDETAWCSAFVNWCITQAGLVGTNSAAAKSWLKWPGGDPVQSPQLGDIVVLNRGTSPWQGHVAFYNGALGRLMMLLGGNQGNKVKISHYSADRVAGIMRPRV